ncbi:hypothetical protein A2U01_0019090, partial [Trifolium medium]|nr:hypothetical protein [Trifolium medium]
DTGIVPMASTDEDNPQAKEKKKTEEPIPACHSKQLVLYYSNKGEEDLKLSAISKEFDDFWDNLITSKEIECDKMWSDFMLELECMKLGWERDEYENTDLSAMNMFKSVSNGEIVSDDEEEEEGEPSHVDA